MIILHVDVFGTEINLLYFVSPCELDVCPIFSISRLFYLSLRYCLYYRVCSKDDEVG